MKDDELGVIWWNHIDESERSHWLKKAGSAVPADAWAAFKRGKDATAAERMRRYRKLKSTREQKRVYALARVSVAADRIILGDKSDQAAKWVKAWARAAGVK